MTENKNNISRVGFIGIGEMGRPMAKNLLKNHFGIITCTHVRKSAVEELEQSGAIVVGSPKEVAGASDVVITMVRDITQTKDVIYGVGSWEGKGVLQGIKTGSSVIICSTLLPGDCRGIAGDLKELQVDVIDAPVSGGTASAESGGLTFMVGGNENAVNKCRSLFEAMGKKIFFLGALGAGQAMKLINNYMMIVNSFGTSEAITMGLKAGIQLQLMLDIIKVSSGNSAVIQNWGMLAANIKANQKTGNISIFRKDLELAVGFFREMGSNTKLGNLVLKMDESLLFPTDTIE